MDRTSRSLGDGLELVDEFQGDVQDEGKDDDISMLDCDVSSEATDGVLGVIESSRNEGETCFGTVSILH